METGMQLTWSHGGAIWEAIIDSAQSAQISYYFAH